MQESLTQDEEGHRFVRIGAHRLFRLLHRLGAFADGGEGLAANSMRPFGVRIKRDGAARHLNRLLGPTDIDEAEGQKTPRLRVCRVLGDGPLQQRDCLIEAVRDHQGPGVGRVVPHSSFLLRMYS